MKRKTTIILSIIWFLLAIGIFVGFYFGKSPAGKNLLSPTRYTYRVVKTFPHDTSAFTQGFEFHDGYLYEGTGLNGHSSIRKVELKTGEVLQRYDVPQKYFGEGITIWGDKIIELTWRSHTGFIYDRDTFKPLGEFHYATEGWGLTHDREKIIMSDGTSRLHFLDPNSFREIGSIDVFDDTGSVKYLNELEYIDGKIYANIWRTDYIAVIEPTTGQVVSYIDLTGILPDSLRTGHEDVLNGIAFDRTNRRLFVTGKKWSKIFEIELKQVK